MNKNDEKDEKTNEKIADFYWNVDKKKTKRMKKIANFYWNDERDDETNENFLILKRYNQKHWFGFFYNCDI